MSFGLLSSLESEFAALPTSFLRADRAERYCLRWIRKWVAVSGCLHCLQSGEATALRFLRNTFKPTRPDRS